MIARTPQLFQLLKHLGPRWVGYRIGHALLHKSGAIRLRLPEREWSRATFEDALGDPGLAEAKRYRALRLQHSTGFFFRPEDRDGYAVRLRGWAGPANDPLEISRKLRAGSLPFFSARSYRVGFPPDWHLNPADETHTPSDLHWSRIDEFAFGDIKLVWEASRFGCVYALVRAYWRTGDESHAEAFWKLVEDWMIRNPPQRGANWRCGQETSLRVMALCFGLHGFLGSPHTTGSRLQRLAELLLLSGRRIVATLPYARGQRNNHAISEAVGLWTLGLLFPEFRDAKRWKREGHEGLRWAASELIYADGSFTQHSTNYHRLMVQLFVWALRLGELNDEPLDADVVAGVARATRFAFGIQDEISGRVPRYGQNDGALVLPLSSTDFWDFRPMLQAASYAGDRRLLYDEGPWDEELFWLFGPAALKAPRDLVPREAIDAGVGGYYTLRSPSGLAFTRCPAKFLHRPSQADLLHVDIWWRGVNIAIDPGTFSYNAKEPWANPLAGTSYHNTVTVNDTDQMTRAGRFLWLPWAHGRSTGRWRSPGDALEYWEGGHDGYESPPTRARHDRGILRIGTDWWLIVDRIDSVHPVHARLHWLLADLPYDWESRHSRLTLQTPDGPYAVQIAVAPGGGEASLVRGDEGGPRGWQAEHYGSRRPALSLDVQRAGESTLFWTLFGPASAMLRTRGDGVDVAGSDWAAEVTTGSRRLACLVRSVTASGSLEDVLETP